MLYCIIKSVPQSKGMYGGSVYFSAWTEIDLKKNTKKWMNIKSLLDDLFHYYWYTTHFWHKGGTYVKKPPKNTQEWK